MRGVSSGAEQTIKDLNHDGTTHARNAEWSDMSSRAMSRSHNAWYHQA